MKDDISPSESSNPRTPSPDIELDVNSSLRKLLNEIFEYEKAAQMNPEPEQPNEIFKFRDPKPEQLNKMFEVEEAARIDPEQEQLITVFQFYIWTGSPRI